MLHIIVMKLASSRTLESGITRREWWCVMPHGRMASNSGCTDVLVDGASTPNFPRTASESGIEIECHSHGRRSPSHRRARILFRGPAPRLSLPHPPAHHRRIGSGGLRESHLAHRGAVRGARRRNERLGARHQGPRGAGGAGVLVRRGPASARAAGHRPRLPQRHARRQGSHPGRRHDPCRGRGDRASPHLERRPRPGALREPGRQPARRHGARIQPSSPAEAQIGIASLHGPLDGIRVLELGQLIAGPFCAKTLGDFGAEVIKIEPPGEGDGLRKWRRMRNGTSLWWHVQSRNKKSVTCDLRRPEGQEIVRRLARSAHIVIENFRPGALEKWNLGWDTLSRDNPNLILVRISGYGQTGPYRERPGFAAIAEGGGGMRHITGFPDRPPVRPNLSLGDTIAALHGLDGALLALYP